MSAIQCLCDFVQNIGLCSDMYCPISLKLGMLIETSKLYILTPVWITSKSQLYEKSKTCGVQFLANLSIDLDEIQYVATICWFAEAHAKFIFVQVLVKEKNSADVIYEKYVDSFTRKQKLLRSFSRKFLNRFG